MLDSIKDKFRKTIQKHCLFEENDRVLLAVSGGMDSIAMLYLFLSENITIGIAHVDHQLRGEESDEDRIFVKELANQLGMDCHIKQVDIEGIAATSFKGKSEIGREERYSFFREICKQHKYNRIATAHHADDRIETFIMRAITGSGLEGLSSIPYQNKEVVRPLLDISREEIKKFIETNNFTYREDSSNQKTDYLRNSIRHNLIPAIEKVNPHFRKSLLHTIMNVGDSHELLHTLIQKTTVKENKSNVNEIEIPTTKKGALTYLHYQLKNYGFSRTQLINILEAESGATVKTESYEILRDRNKLLIRPIDQDVVKNHDVDIPEKGHFALSSNEDLIIEESSTSEKTNNPNIEYVDADKIQFPLTIRKWRPGDKFRPIGMNGKSQSLQDYFTNQKLSLFEKEATWLLESNGIIYWVIGHRISHDIRITENTKSLLRLEYKINETSSSH